MESTTARAEGIGDDRLPDFPGLEHDGEFALLGQDELGRSALENAFKDQIAKAAAERIWTEQTVLSNCGQRCVFCGLKPASFGRQAHTRRWSYAARSHIVPGNPAWPGRAGTGNASAAGRLGREVRSRAGKRPLTRH